MLTHAKAYCPRTRGEPEEEDPRLAMLQLDAAAFEARVRALEAGRPSVYDICRATILLERQGSYKFVLEDLHCVLPKVAAESVEALLEAAGVPGAFTVRREIINFKKVLLLLFQAGRSDERALAQLLTFFHCDLLAANRASATSLSVEQARYVEIATASAKFGGALRAVHDARDQVFIEQGARRANPGDIARGGGALSC
ncbi:hypothetical protein T492DRAFT_275079 [Pavlovales sp. CCMP2436]|nr:hypothetical protein T492DRAFT_275079 [Pavlovales sp. CCMP2436]